MDHVRFDNAARSLGAQMTRRTGLATALGAALAGLLGGAAAAKGPCGNGSAKANACKTNANCCTKYCVKGKCRCKPNGMACAKAAHCCGGTCSGGICDSGGGGGGGGGGGCGPATCAGCCDGSTCRAGTSNAACGKGGRACARCGGFGVCANGACGGLDLCGVVSCPTGCCSDGVCKTGASASACGSGGKTCKRCSADTPYCVRQRCEECRDNNDCAAGACMSGRCRSLVLEESFGSYDLNAPAGLVDPSAIFMSADGARLWIADSGRDQISVWDRGPSGWTHKLNFGTHGSGSGQFNGPRGVWVTPDETVFVADFFNNRVSVWRRVAGPLLDGWSWIANFGDTGPAESRLVNPVKVAASAFGGIVLVTEYNLSGARGWVRSGDSWTPGAPLDTPATEPYGATGVWISGDAVTSYLANHMGNQLQEWWRPDGFWHFIYVINSYTQVIKAPRGISSIADERTVWTTSLVAEGRGAAIAISESNAKWSLAVDYRKSASVPLGELRDIAASANGKKVAFIEGKYQAPRIYVLTYA